MCKTLFISGGPSQHKVEEKYGKIKDKPKFKDYDEKEKYRKEAEIYFTTLGLGKITGLIVGLDKMSDGLLVITLQVKRIGQDTVRAFKRWKAYYDPHSRQGMFYYKE